MRINILFLFFLAFFVQNLCASQQASIVIDAISGKVLHSSQADKQHAPASLTKMMTLYLLFEALERKECSLNTYMSVSRFAAQQSPTKIHLKAGDKLMIKQAILALAIKSANDASVVIAEHLAGSEEKFARLMTRKAHSLGMKSTQFFNASGLPHPYQKTTARDMATLGLALMHHFPQFYPLFSTKHFQFRGKTYANHNKLLFSYKGCTGLKTGYTRASGFNLAASAIRNGQHVIGVVLGEKSPAARNKKMSKLMDQCFQTNLFAQETSQPKLIQIVPRYAEETAAKKIEAISSTLSGLPSLPAHKQNKLLALQVGAYQTPHAARNAAEMAIKASLGFATAKNIAIRPFSHNGKKVYRAHLINIPEEKTSKICQSIIKNKLPCKKIG